MKPLFEYINEAKHSSLFNHCVNILLDRPGWSMESAEEFLDKCSDYVLKSIYATNGRWLDNPQNDKYLPKFNESKNQSEEESVNEAKHSSLFNHCVNILLDRGYTTERAEKFLDRCSDFVLNKIYDTDGRWLDDYSNAKYLPKSK